jgi:hypothetical protein
MRTQVTHCRCPGATLPGLSDSLVVEFCPDQLRYYYDAIRVHSSVSGAAGNAGLQGPHAPQRAALQKAG